jgi:hypothetical protein
MLYEIQSISAIIHINKNTFMLLHEKFERKKIFGTIQLSHSLQDCAVYILQGQTKCATKYL